MISTVKIWMSVLKIKVCKGRSELVKCNLPFQALLLGQQDLFFRVIKDLKRIGTFRWRIAKRFGLERTFYKP